MTDTSVTLAAGDAIELLEALDLLRTWLNHDAHRIEASLRDYMGWDGYTFEDLHNDLGHLIRTLAEATR